MNDLNIILNGKKYNAETGETILSCAKRNNIEIPTLCNDPRLDPYSSCFVCVVEIEGMKGLQPSCSTLVKEGMSIETENDKVRTARKSALDLIVSNHYADCAAPCKTTCPAGVDVQGYISLIEKGLYSDAIGLIKEVNPLPAICGRVCVRPCEVACRRNLVDDEPGVGIDYLKRFAADTDLASSTKYIPELAPSTGKKVAVIGAGPGGLSAAWFLQIKGHQVDIYEASPNPGGMLRYGIPPYRLPNELLDAEVANITDLGTKIFYNTKLGDNLSYNEIQNKYQATVLTIGSQKGTGVGCPGDDAGNVFSGIDFLRNIEITDQKPDFSGKTVAVIGGGNTAMDCCRTAMRIGAEKVYVIYRRTEKEMPANPIEIHESKEEGIEYLFLNNPVEIHKHDSGDIRSMTVIKMELGEPDASGRRRPIPIEGSEYEIELDYVLAAIGQKTQVNFINDINASSKEGELKINRWGDIDADKTSLQTGISSIFAAGDGVTGPATLIEAIAQAKIASRSCHQFLSGEKISPEPKEFLSKKDNFIKQDPAEYTRRYTQQLRQEMPLIPPANRHNFKEVELGYSEEMALEETARCLECGCTEYFTCNLKQLCDQYGADQTKYAGDYQSFEIRFDHPYIEIDNNKCILCSRCIRICQEVVGASALGLVNRGFETFVAPSMGDSLVDTNCESCGLCISACPTGAITENKTFKPGPVALQKKELICNYCSVGCTINAEMYNSFTWKMTGGNGLVNPEGNLCRYGKFGYEYRNRTDRITKPMIKTSEGFEEITFREAFNLIKDKVNGVNANENMVFAGARLSNEELLLVKRFGHDALKTNHVGSFHYLGRGKAFHNASDLNVPFSQLNQASHIFLIGTEIHEENAVAGFIVNQAHKKHGVQLSYISLLEQSKLQKKADSSILVESYSCFLKAVNHYLLSNNKQNDLYLRDHVRNVEEYKKDLLKEDYFNLVFLSGISQDSIEAFANLYNNEQNAVMVFSDVDLTSSEITEIGNLALITGKLGKTASGIICLKEKNNSQGLIDLDIASDNDPIQELETGKMRNLFIFGEDPLGCAVYREEVENWLNQTEFIVVQDYFLSETSQLAHLILPASIPGEFAGSFTNTQKMIQVFEKNLDSKLEMDASQQLIEIMKIFGINGIQDMADAQSEVIKYVSEKKQSINRILIPTTEDHYSVFFKHGCDLLVKLFDESFESSFR